MPFSIQINNLSYKYYSCFHDTRVLSSFYSSNFSVGVDVFLSVGATRQLLVAGYGLSGVVVLSSAIPKRSIYLHSLLGRNQDIDT